MRLPADQASPPRSLRHRPLFAPLIFPALGFLALVALVVWLAWAWQQTTTVVVMTWDEQSLGANGRGNLLQLAGRVESDGLYAVQPSPFAALALMPPGDPLPQVAPSDLGALLDAHAGQTLVLVVRMKELDPLLQRLDADLAADDVAPGSVLVISDPQLGDTRVVRFAAR